MSIGPEVRRDPQRRRVERVTLAISILVLQLLVGLLLYQGVILEEGPPVIVVEPHFDAVRQEGARYYLPVTIANEGEQTAEGVRVIFHLIPASSAETPETANTESADVTVPFLAGGGSVEGAVVFDRLPTAETVRHVASYLEP
ncbi:MAG: hypothetical protein R3272_04135 [Candidatus Promineifilaceae bacterium]|nr:hypothetical protein [Candidatus Promineifilaceae bacterium]